MAYEFRDPSPNPFQANAELESIPHSSPEPSTNVASHVGFENLNHLSWSMANGQIEQVADMEHMYPTSDWNNERNAQHNGFLLFEDAPTHPNYSYNTNMDSESEPSASSSRTTRRKELFAGPAPSEIQDSQFTGTMGSSSGTSQEEFSQHRGDLPTIRRLKRRREDSSDLESPSHLHERLQQQVDHTLLDPDNDKSHFQQISHFQDHDSSDTEGVVSAIDKKGKGKERVEPEDSPGLEMMTGSSRSGTSSTKLPTAPVANAKPVHEPLSSYTCPICFSAPTNATLTPCGHICCGECLFTAVKTTIHRATLAGADDASEAKCPVCRATIPGWDGKGGGVIGLKPRAIFSL